MGTWCVDDPNRVHPAICSSVVLVVGMFPTSPGFVGATVVTLHSSVRTRPGLGHPTSLGETFYPMVVVHQHPHSALTPWPVCYPTTTDLSNRSHLAGTHTSKIDSRMTILGEDSPFRMDATQSLSR